jgi:hypothetical protein
MSQVEDLRMDAHHERLLVVAPIEDADAAAFGEGLETAPEVVVIEFLAGRHLEGEYLAALRVDARHHVLDGAVLARGIHGLEDEEHGPTVLRVEHILKLGERGDAGGEGLLGPRFVAGGEIERVRGIVVGETKAVAGRDTEGPGEPRRRLTHLSHVHGLYLPASSSPM